MSSCLHLELTVGFLQILDLLYFPCIQPTPIVISVCASLNLWYHIALSLLFDTDARTLAFVSTDLLSQNTSADLSIGTPDIQRVYINASTMSVKILRATNSKPKLLLSAVFCLLLNQLVGKLFK